MIFLQHNATVFTNYFFGFRHSLNEGPPAYLGIKGQWNRLGCNNNIRLFLK